MRSTGRHRAPGRRARRLRSTRTSSPAVRSCVHHPVEVPGVRDTLQLVFARVFEGRSAPGDEVLHRRRRRALPTAPRGRRRRRRHERRCPRPCRPSVAFACCSPALISSPRSRTASAIDVAQWIARAGPSKVAKNPSPAVSTWIPRYRRSAPAPPRGGAPGALSTRRRRCRGPLRRAHDVREEHRRQHTVEHGLLCVQGRQEAAYLPQDRLRRRVPDEILAPWYSTSRATGMRSAR